MKTINSFIILLSAAVTATAQSYFKASLAPSNPEYSWVSSSSAISLVGSSASFAITMGYEGIVPTTALLSGTNAELTIELGAESGVVHYPLPWPSEPWDFDYGASTQFYGSFLLPDNLREDFVAGRTTLLLLGSPVGDFTGPILPASSPKINGIEWQGSSIGILFTAEPPYRYTVEYAQSPGGTNWSALGVVDAFSRTFEAVKTDSVTNGLTRFYRIQRELYRR